MITVTSTDQGMFVVLPWEENQFPGVNPLVIAADARK